MLEKLKVFETAWVEFEKWLILKHYKTDGCFVYKEIDGLDDIIHDYELYGLAIEWLDGKGIYVEIQHYPSISKKAKIYWHWEIKGELSPKGFVSRPEATEAGIIKGFEILNQRGEK